MSDLEELLRKSLEQRQTSTEQPLRDLNAVVAELSAAVEKVTNGRLKVQLQPLRPKAGYGPTFALTLYFSDDEERILRVLALREAGYPVIVWFTYEAWDTQRRDPTRDHPALEDAAQLREFIQRLLSKPESELVRLIAYELAITKEKSDTLAGSVSS